MFNRKELDKLYQYAYSLTSNSHDAEDLLHTVIERMIKKLAHTEIEFTQAYTRKAIRNQFIDDCRHKNRIAFDTLDDHPMLLSTTDLEKSYVDQHQVDQLMQCISVGEKELLYLWSVLGFTTSEIVEETGQPRGTILSRLFRIKEKLKTIHRSLSSKEEGY
ncbi:RNA polymerase sigma factor [Pseudomonas sp. HK3]